MARPMLILGGYQFQLDTAAYQTLQRTTLYRWEQNARIGQHAATHWVGPGQDKISLQGTIYPQFKGGLGQVDEMRKEAAYGTPLQLVDGQGQVHGFWVIERVREDNSHHAPGGIPRKIDFRLELVYYGETAP